MAMVGHKELLVSVVAIWKLGAYGDISGYFIYAIVYPQLSQWFIIDSYIFSPYLQPLRSHLGSNNSYIKS